MGISEVRSPNNRERPADRPYRDRPGASPNSAPRADEHIGPHAAGKGWTPEALRRDSTPVAGENRPVIGDSRRR